MPQINITVSDGLNAKIVELYGSEAAWKDAVKTWTRKQWLNEKVRRLNEEAEANKQAAIALLDQVS